MQFQQHETSNEYYLKFPSSESSHHIRSSFLQRPYPPPITPSAILLVPVRFHAICKTVTVFAAFRTFSANRVCITDQCYNRFANQVAASSMYPIQLQPFASTTRTAAAGCGRHTDPVTRSKNHAAELSDRKQAFIQDEISNKRTTTNGSTKESKQVR